MSNNLVIYKAIAKFLNKELTANKYSLEVNESLEVAKQCLENAFNFSTNDCGEAPDLLSLFQLNGKKTEKIQPSSEAVAMAETLKNQGNLCMKEEKFDEAVACYTKAIEASPCMAVYYCNRAAAYSRLNKHQNAVDDCKKALEIDPQYSKAYGRMGIAYSSLGNYTKAVECYRKGLELDPTNENCQQNLSIAEERLRQNGSEGAQFSNLNLGAIFNNPMMQNIAQQFMSDPNAQNVMTNLLRSTFSGSNDPTSQQQPAETQPTTPNTNGTSEGSRTTQNTDTQQSSFNMNDVLRIGQQFAHHLQSSNPDLVNNLRQTFQSNINQSSDDSNRNGNNNQDEPPDYYS